MPDGFRCEEMNHFLRFGQLDVQTGKFLLEPVKSLAHFGAELLHLNSQLVGGVLDFSSELIPYFVDLGADVMRK
ncbi:hypothetical protein [Geobacillus subterraneus]|uniref:hypothetical protein n=1 Tax=Geobacillus subterraneus TaxID=129338 RepID=UPI0016168F7F